MKCVAVSSQGDTICRFRETGNTKAKRGEIFEREVKGREGEEPTGEYGRQVFEEGLPGLIEEPGGPRKRL